MAQMHEVPFPFVRTKFAAWDEGGDWRKVDRSWRPGTQSDIGGDGDPSYNDQVWVADSMGHMLLTELKRVEIPGYVDRVFYKREWRDPEGKVYGRNQLRCISAPAFKRMLKGYRHKFELA